MMNASQIKSQKRHIRADLENLDEFYTRDKITDFVIFYLQREMHLGAGMERPSYLADYYLDLERLRAYADQDRHHEITDDEVSALHLSPKDMEALFKGSQDDHRENKWADTCQWILDLLDEGYEKTMEVLNQELVVVVVNGPDREYPDYRDPFWQVINQERMEISFKEINLTEYEGQTIGLNGYLSYVQNPPVERIRNATWTCVKCDDQEQGEEQPKYCSTCQKNSTFVVDESSIEKEKIQEAVLMEAYEASSSGFQALMPIMVTKEDTGRYAPGDRVSILGKVVGRIEKNRGKDPIYRYVVECSQIRKEERTISIKDSDIKEIEKFSKRENVLDSLAELYAPGIIGHEHVKKAILLQAAGVEERKRGGKRVRGNIHILLVGDPGTGKSQLLMASPQASPKAIYVTDASAAGLTAAVDEVNGKRVMVAGVMVMADRGIAAIDELEKMSGDDRKAIHPAMEQGEIHKSKAGLHASFKSRTSVLAAANPKYGRFIESESIPQQINLEPSLLDRFDLIFIFKEQPGKESYEKQRALLILEGGDDGKQDDFLLKYIAYSKKYNPDIPKGVRELIAEYYSSLKSKPENKDHFLNARTLESLQRLTLASARLRFSDVADEEDLANAKDLMEMYLAQFSYDMDAISGITGTVRDCIVFLKNMITSDASVPEQEILDQCRPLGFSLTNVRAALDQLMRVGELYSPRDGVYRGVSR